MKKFYGETGSRLLRLYWSILHYITLKDSQMTFATSHWILNFFLAENVQKIKTRDDSCIYK